MEPPEKIVVRGVNWLGDVIMTTPALLRLREKFPRAEISVFTPAKLADLYAAHPAVDRILTFAKGEGFASVARKIRAAHADLAVIFPNSYRSALEMFWARVPSRVGFGGGRGVFLTRAISNTGVVKMRKRTGEEIQDLVQSNAPYFNYPVHAHHIHHYLRIVQEVGASADPMPPHIEVTAQETSAFRERWNISTQTRWIGLNAGAEYGPAKRWYPERFLETAVLLSQAGNLGFLIFGGAGDISLAANLAGQIRQKAGAPVVQVTGQTTLRELAAGLKCCELVLTNDTGPMHLAAAVGTKVAAIFGSTSPELTGPGLPGSAQHLIIRSTVPCTPCFLRECPIDFRCMKQITPAEVARVIAEKL